MANYNKVMLMGNLTRDPEQRSGGSGVAVVKFGMAINRKWKEEETTCFVDCTAFGQQGAAIARYLFKGKPIFVEGRLDFQTWQDKQGNKRSKIEVIVEQFQFIGTAAKDEADMQKPHDRPMKDPEPTTWGGSVDDVPF